ncbi:CoA-binding domain-containing protein, partial [mine drainage metagenome]
MRDPVRFRQALDLAARRDVPVVALKVGREALARAMVTAHSGALAGADLVFDAVCDAHGVLRVDTLDAMLDTVELLATGRRAGPGGLAAVHDSGGERAMLIDAAARVGVPFAAISDATRGRLAAVLEPGLPAVNPLDAWGTGNGADTLYQDCCTILLDDPATALLALVVDLTHEQDPEHEYAGTLLRVAPTTEPPGGAPQQL